MLFNGQRITPKQKLILQIIFQFRGMTVDQLLPELEDRLPALGVSVMRSPKSFRKNTYKDLQALEELRLIERDPIKLERTVDFMYLTEAGLECVYEMLEIPPGYVGTGWDSNWGDFPYDLQRPPKVSSALIHHHLMLTNVLLCFERLRFSNPILELDYRDNRYSSVEYEHQGEKHRFRPDTEIIMSAGTKKRFLIEVDRGTEFAEKLREKFRSYSQYLAYLKGKGEQLPDGIIFVMSNGTSRRWSLVRSSFINEMGDFATEFNLIGCNFSDIASVLFRQRELQQHLIDFYETIRHYRTENTPIWPIKEGQGIEWDRAIYSVIKHDEKVNRLYVFERFDPFETLWLARGHAWWKWKNNAKFSDIIASKYFIPVLWQSKSEPCLLIFKGLDAEEEFKEAFANRIWLRTNPHPQWFNTAGEQVNVNHPMLRFPL